MKHSSLLPLKELISTIAEEKKVLVSAKAQVTNKLGATGARKETKWIFKSSPTLYGCVDKLRPHAVPGGGGPPCPHRARRAWGGVSLSSQSTPCIWGGVSLSSQSTSTHTHRFVDERTHIHPGQKL